LKFEILIGSDDFKIIIDFSLEWIIFSSKNPNFYGCMKYTMFNEAEILVFSSKFSSS